MADPRIIKDKYNNAFNSFCKYYEYECLKNKIDYIPITTDDSLDKSLMQYLIKRNQINY